MPSSRTDPGFDLTALLNGFEPLFATLEPEQINQLSSSIIAVMQGQGGTIESLLTETSTLTNHLADKDAVLGQVLDNLVPVLHDLASRGDELDQTRRRAPGPHDGVGQGALQHRRLDRRHQRALGRHRVAGVRGPAAAEARRPHDARVRPDRRARSWSASRRCSRSCRAPPSLRAPDVPRLVAEHVHLQHGGRRRQGLDQRRQQDRPATRRHADERPHLSRAVQRTDARPRRRRRSPSRALFVAAISFVPFGQQDYTAILEHTAGIRVGEEVQVAGVGSGEVRGIELDGHQVRLTFTLDRDIHLGRRHDGVGQGGHAAGQPLPRGEAGRLRRRCPTTPSPSSARRFRSTCRTSSRAPTGSSRTSTPRRSRSPSKSSPTPCRTRRRRPAPPSMAWLGCPRSRPDARTR